MAFKHPVSVLVVVYAANTGRVLMLQRRDDVDFWQSVTGSQETWESPARTAQREVLEETGIDICAEQLTLADCQRHIEFKIFPHFLHRYVPGTTHNREHWFTLALTAECDITLSEHLAFQWLDAPAAAALTKSWSNRQAIKEFVV